MEVAVRDAGGRTTLTGAADKVLRVGAPNPYLVNIELQSYHDAGLARTLWFGQVALDYRHDLPVLTVLILLSKTANSPGLTGVYERQLPDGSQTNRYNYRVVRLWEEDPVLNMHQSTNYQAILEEGLQKGLQQGLQQGLQEGLIEGRVAGERQLLVRQGIKRFGNPDAAILAAIEAIKDLDRLEALGERILDPNVRDWNSLIGGA